MRALEICLNGKKLCVAGVGDNGVVTANICCVLRGGKDELSLDTGGINSATQEHWRWRGCEVKVGDKIQVTVVEAPKADKPGSRKPVQVNKADQLRLEKRLVRQLARKFGWKIQTRPAK
jgi:hypothetical protein